MIRIKAKGLVESRREANRMMRRVNIGISRAVAQGAQELRKEMMEGLRNQAPGGQAILPLSDMTIMLRGLKTSKTKHRTALGRSVSGPLAPGQRRVKKARRSQGRRNLGAGFAGPLARKQKRGRVKKKPRRGPSKALIRHGDLLRSINVEKLSPKHHTVGVHRGAKGRKSGKDMMNIAEIQEYGTKQYSQTVTVKMAAFSRFLVAMGVLYAPWKVGQVLRKQTPARPFLRPAYELWSLTANERFVTRLAQAGLTIRG